MAAACAKLLPEPRARLMKGMEHDAASLGGERSGREMCASRDREMFCAAPSNVAMAW